MGLGRSAARRTAALVVLQEQLAGLAAMAAEVDGVRLVAQQQFLQIGHVHRPCWRRSNWSR